MLTSIKSFLLLHSKSFANIGNNASTTKMHLLRIGLLRMRTRVQRMSRLFRDSHNTKFQSLSEACLQALTKTLSQIPDSVKVESSENNVDKESKPTDQDLTAAAPAELRPTSSVSLAFIDDSSRLHVVPDSIPETPLSAETGNEAKKDDTPNSDDNKPLPQKNIVDDNQANKHDDDLAHPTPSPTSQNGEISRSIEATGKSQRQRGSVPSPQLEFYRGIFKALKQCAQALRGSLGPASSRASPDTTIVRGISPEELRDAQLSTSQIQSMLSQLQTSV